MTSGPPRRACEMMLWFILFFGVAAFGATEWWSRSLLEFFIFILAAMCCLRGDFNPPAGGPLIGFMVIIALGAAQALNVRPLAGPAGLLPFTAARPQTLYALLLWAALAALFWSASGILLWEGALRRLALAIFVIGLFIAVVGMLQRGQGNTAYYGLRPVRPGCNPFGPFVNYDDAANWMIGAIFIGAGFFAEQMLRRWRVHLADRAAQLALAVFLLGVTIAAVLTTGSRGAINSFFGSVLLTGFLVAGSFKSSGQRRSSRASLIVLGSLYAYFLYANPKMLGFAGGAFDASAAYRVSMYRSGLRMFLDFPVLGVGLGGFQNAFHAYQEHFVVGLVDHVHSSWLEVALESGILGLLSFSTAILAPLVRLGRSLTLGTRRPGVVTAAWFSALFALLLHGLVEFTFQIPANVVLFVVTLAAVIACLGGGSPSTFRLGLAPAAAFVVLALLSLPPGVSGMSPRFGAPFVASGEQLLARRDADAINIHP